jgi:hypothetical protein
MTQLRGETAAAVKAGTDDVFTRTGALVGSVRNEMATTANGLRTEFQGTITRETQKISTDFSSRLAQSSTGGTVLRPGTGGTVVIRPVNP